MPNIPIAAGLALLSAMLAAPVQAQLYLYQTQSPNTLVQTVLLGPGIEVDSITFNGHPGSQIAPTGVGPSEMGRFNGSNCNVGLAAGLFLCPGVGSVHLPGPNHDLRTTGGGISAAQGILTPDQDLSKLSGWPWWETGNNIYNKAVLEFDLVPDNDMLSFRYVFSSEEYERWVCTQYNDVFGWFLSGPGIEGPYTEQAINIAFVPGSLSPVAINSINSGQTEANANGPLNDLYHYCDTVDPNWTANTAYYRYNGGQWPAPQPIADVAQLEAPYNNDPYYIAHNGLTVVLTASAAVEIGQRYRMKMAVSNVGDSRYPSAVYVEQNSFRASDRFTLTVDPGPTVDLSGATPVLYQSSSEQVQLRLNRWGGFYLDEDVLIAVEGDAVAGVDYLPALPQSIHFDQLDSAAVITLSLPPGNDASELVVKLTCGTGQKEQYFPLSIAEESTVGVPLRVVGQLPVFPNPADRSVQVGLPVGLDGDLQVELLDVAGRVVRRIPYQGVVATIDVTDLPEGLYQVKATGHDRLYTARVVVRH